MLKDKIKGTIIGVVIGATLTGGVAMAAHTTTLYDVVANGIKIVVDGKKLNPTDAKGNKVEPMIYNGTTYLPVRAVADALGKAVYWDGPNYTVYLGEMDGKLDYPTIELENMETLIGAPSKTNKIEDNYGNSYDRAVHSTTMEFLLNMKYSRFKATFYIPKGENIKNAWNRINIIADGKTIYTSPKMDITSRPIDINIDITGCNHLIIKPELYSDFFSSISGGREYNTSCLGNAGFYQ